MYDHMNQVVSSLIMWENDFQYIFTWSNGRLERQSQKNFVYAKVT